MNALDRRQTREVVLAWAEASARELLGLTWEEARELLASGRLDGTLSGEALRAIRYLVEEVS